MFLIRILFLLIFFTGCAPKAYYKKLSKGKEIQTGTQSVKSNITGEIYIKKSPINCEVILINSDKSVLVRKQSFILKKGQSFKMSIRNGFYELNIVYQNRTFFFNVGSTYLNLWKINLRYYLEKVKDIRPKMKEDFFIIKI